MSETGLTVVSSTNPGTFALTGVVIDDAGNAVPAAVVTLRSDVTGMPVEGLTDALGAFAFINVPASTVGERFDLEVLAPGHGAYNVLNDLYDPNDTYVINVQLDQSSQTFNLATTAKGDSTLTGSSTTTTDYDANKRVPPTILVSRMTTTSDGCTKASGASVIWTRRFPWKFYVLHVMRPEIGGNSYPGGYFDQTAAKGVASAIQNYAWYHRRTTATAANGADVDNTTSYQCFWPWAKVRRVWRSWVNDIQDERISFGGETGITQYRAGSYNCTEGSYPADGNKLSQLGAKARDESCGVNNWRNIAEYYYTGSVVGGQQPPVPQTSYSTTPDGIRFTFRSIVGDSPVGWRYVLERHRCLGGGECFWGAIYNRGWSWKSRSVPTSFKYETGDCGRFRVKASNPVGASKYASYNNEQFICPNAG